MGLDWLPELFKEEPPLLFLGAGPSIAQGGPDWKLLGKIVAEACAIEPASLPVVASRLIVRQRRADLEREVARELDRLPPSHDLADLLSLPWQAVFTTNYDLTQDVVQGMHLPRPVKVFDDGHVQPPADGSVLPVYKLMGSTRKRHPERGFMLLSKTDLNAPNEVRLAYLEILKDFLPTSPMLVVGSSLDDWILIGTLEQAIQLHGQNSRKRIVLVSPNPPEDDAGELAKDLELEWHAGDTAAVAAALRGRVSLAPRPRGRVVRAGSRQIELGPITVLQEIAGGVIVDADFRGTTFKTQSEFYRVSQYSKQAFSNKWDFPRDIEVIQRRTGVGGVRTLWTREAISRLQDLRKSGACPPVALLGAAGSAKTMTALRITHDWCALGGTAVYVDASRLFLGFEPTANLVRDLAADLRAGGAFGDPAYGGMLIVLDNAVNSRNAAIGLRKQLLREGLTDSVLLVIGQERDCPPGRQRDQFEEVWSLSPTVTAEERERFVKFALATIPDVTETAVDDALRLADSDSFFELLYTLVAPAREPLDKSILRVLDSLGPEERELVISVATFHHSDVPFYPSLAAVKWPERYNRGTLAQEIEIGGLRQVLERQTVGGVEILRCLSHKQADIVFNARVKGASKRLADVLLTFIPLVHHNDEEQRLFQDAVIEAARRRTRRKEITVSEAEKIFMAAAASHPTRPFLQHYGIVLRELREWKAAEEQLRRAISTFDFKQGSEVVYHSLGELYYHWGRHLAPSSPGEAETKYLLARDSYERARTAVPEYAQHGFAKLAIARAQIAADQRQRRILYIEALNHSLSGLLLAADSDQKAYFERTRNQAREGLARDVVDVEDAGKLARELADATPFIFLAERIRDDRDPTEMDATEVAECLQLLSQGWVFDKRNPALRYAKVRYRYALDPVDSAVLDLIDDLAGAVWAQEIARLRARSLASLNQWKEASRVIRDADLFGTGLEARTEIRGEDLVREKSGPRTWVVEERDGQQFIRLHNNVQFATPGFEPGATVALAAMYGRFSVVGR